MPRIPMIFAALLLLADCGPGPLADIAYMPPDEYLRPYNGTVVVMPASDGVISSSETKPSIKTCIIRIQTAHTVPAAGPMSHGPYEAPRSAWRIGDELRRGLFLYELGECNGAADVNADPARRFIPAGYERTVAAYNWKPIYDRLAPTAKWIGIQP